MKQPMEPCLETAFILEVSVIKHLENPYKIQYQKRWQCPDLHLDPFSVAFIDQGAATAPRQARRLKSILVLLSGDTHLFIYIYIYAFISIYTYMCMCVYIYIYIYSLSVCLSLSLLKEFSLWSTHLAFFGFILNFVCWGFTCSKLRT